MYTETRRRQVQWSTQGLPTFHAMGFMFQVALPFVSSAPISVYEPQYPHPPIVPNLNNFMETSRATGATAIPAVPAFVEVCYHCLLIFLVFPMTFIRLGLNRQRLSNI